LTAHDQTHLSFEAAEQLSDGLLVTRPDAGEELLKLTLLLGPIAARHGR
jgi:hypothetical protein